MYEHQEPNSRRLDTRRVSARPVATANPLERSVDITERRLQKLVVILAIFLLPAIIAPGVLIWQTRDDSPRIVTSTAIATTTAGAAPIAPITSTIGADNSNKVAAHWSWQGRDKTGVITVPPGTDAGTRIPITLDEQGNPRPAVPIPADAGVTAVMVVVVLLGVLMGTVIATMTWIRRRYDRKREVLWDEALHRFFS